MLSLPQTMMLSLVGNSGHWSKEHSYLLQLHLYFTWKIITLTAMLELFITLDIL